MIKHMVYVLQDTRSGEVLAVYDKYAAAYRDRNVRAYREYGEDSWLAHVKEAYKIIELELIDDFWTG